MIRTVLQNPYIAETPVKDELRFYGREQLLKRIQQFPQESGNNVQVLYGHRRIGKTSLLFQLERGWQTKSFHNIVYFDFRSHSEWPIGQILFAIACALSKCAQLAQPEQSCFDDDGRFFSGEFLPRILERCQSCVLLFDGFDALDAAEKTAQLHPLLRQIYEWTQQFKSLKFVFALRQHPENLNYFPAMFDFVVPVEIPALSSEETEQLIRSSEINPVSLYWTERAVELVWQWTRGHPYFTQLLCSEIWRQMSCHEPAETPLATEQNVEFAVTKVLKNDRETIEKIWNDARSVEKLMLSALAQDASEKQESAVNMEEFTESLEKYCRAGLLFEEAHEHHFSVPLLKRWIVENVSLSTLKNEFIESLTNKVVSTLLQASQPIIVIWGNVPFFQGIANGLAQNLTTHKRGLYLGINMKETKQDTVEETFFKLVQLLGDNILQKVPGAENVAPLYKALYRLQQTQKEVEQAEPSTRLNKLLEYCERDIYPAFREALRGQNQVIISLEHFDSVLEWRVKIRRFVLDVLLKNMRDLNVKWLLLARASKEMSLHYGSDRENSSEDILVYELGRDIWHSG